MLAQTKQLQQAWNDKLKELKQGERQRATESLKTEAEKRRQVATEEQERRKKQPKTRNACGRSTRRNSES